MFGRRSHPRFSITTPSEGTLRVLRDVLVQRAVGDELVAISREAGVVGEILTLEVAERTSGSNVATKVRVIESRPMVLDGAVRHRLRLEQVNPPLQAA